MVLPLRRVPKPRKLVFSEKTNKQLSTRGWTKELVVETIDSSTITRKATNKATGGNATAYYRKDGSYVVCDDITAEIIQVSKIGDPDWTPDRSIEDPYKP